VFEVRHSGPNEKPQGFFVTSDGLVRRVDFGAAIGFPLPKSPTGRTLETVTQIAKPTMDVLLTLVPAAAGGALACRTPGTEQRQTDYVAWIVDGHGGYSRVWLSREGQMHCSNTAAEARVLLAWLYKYVGAERTVFNRASVGCPIAMSSTDQRRCQSNELPVRSSDGVTYCSERLDVDYENTCNSHGNYVCAGGRSHCRELDSGVLTCAQ
jgi:hypothetical protein